MNGSHVDLFFCVAFLSFLSLNYINTLLRVITAEQVLVPESQLKRATATAKLSEKAAAEKLARKKVSFRTHLYTALYCEVAIWVMTTTFNMTSPQGGDVVC